MSGGSSVPEPEGWAAGGESRLERILRSGHFAVTSDVGGGRSADGSRVAQEARDLLGYVDAVNVGDNPLASPQLAGMAEAAFVAAAGVEPTLQLTCRDRNRIALTSDLLGGWALGARNLLCLSGDPISAGDHPNAAAVDDLSVVDLVRLAAGLRREGTMLSGRKVEGPAPGYFVGVADSPLVEDYDPGRLDAKLDAGAMFVQTQIAYEPEPLTAWAEALRARGVPERAFVLVGVAPLHSYRLARWVNDHLPGVTVPAQLLRDLAEAGPDAQGIGVGFVVELVRRLRGLPGIAGVHVMNFGREEAVRLVIEGAGLLPRPDQVPGRSPT